MCEEYQDQKVCFQLDLRAELKWQNKRSRRPYKVALRECKEAQGDLTLSTLEVRSLKQIAKRKNA